MSYSTLSKDVFQRCEENEYFAKYRCLPIINTESIPCNNHFHSILASSSDQSCYDLYNLSSDNEEYLKPRNVAETTPRWSDHAESLLTAARLYLNSLPELPQSWVEMIPNFTDYHYDSMQTKSIFRIPDFTDWWHQQKEMHLQYADHLNVAYNIFSITTCGIREEASCFLGRKVIG